GGALDEEQVQLALAGTEGRVDVVLVDGDGGPRLVTTLAVEGRSPIVRERPASAAAGFGVVAANWARAISGDEEPLFPPTDAVGLHGLLDRVRSARPQRSKRTTPQTAPAGAPTHTTPQIARPGRRFLRPFRIGVVGAGRRAGDIIPVLQGLGEKVLVAAVCDLDRRRPRATATTFAIAHHHGSLDAMVAAYRFDAVVIATPPD